MGEGLKNLLYRRGKENNTNETTKEQKKKIEEESKSSTQRPQYELVSRPNRRITALMKMRIFWRNSAIPGYLSEGRCPVDWSGTTYLAKRIQAEPSRPPNASTNETNTQTLALITELSSESPLPVMAS